MSNIVKHKTQSAVADLGVAGEVSPDNWNEEHSFAGGALGSLLYRDTGQSDGANWLADVAVGQVLVSGGVGAAPAYSASPSLTSLTLSSALGVASGGTGVATFASNGVLYGNAAGVVQVTAQGGANTVLTANAGAPTFSATPTLTSLTLTGALTVGTVHTVPNGGTGVATLATGGVLYGNGAGVVLVTAIGAANSVLTHNAAVPSFSATPTVTTLTTTGLLTAGDALTVSAGALTVSAVGPHAIGGAISTLYELYLRGTHDPSATAGAALAVGTTLTLATGEDAYGVLVAPTFTEFSSGVHALLAGIRVAPTITAGVATATVVAGISVAEFAAQTGTDDAAGLHLNVPTGGTRNYPLWILGGVPRHDGTLQATIGANGGASALTALPVGYVQIYLGGTTKYIIPYYNS